MADSAAAAVSAAVVDLAAAAAVSASSLDVRLELLGAPLDPLSLDGTRRRIAEHLAGDESTLLHVATLNPEYVMAARASDAFCDALERAGIVTPDGAGVIVAVRWLTGRRLQRVTGVELASWLLGGEFAGAPRVFLLGRAASVAGLQGRHPTRVVGRWGSGTPDRADDAESIARIRERNANVLLVGYGAPAQVLWIERNRDALAANGVRVAIGVGGALDYLAGETPRAPVIIQNAGLEWAYRLAREPWRWRRQLALPGFALATARTWFRQWSTIRNRACRILSGDETLRRSDKL